MSEMHELAEEYFEAWLTTEPTWRHLLGDFTAVGEVERLSREQEDTDIAMHRSFAARAEAIDPAGLDDDDQVTRGVLLSGAQTQAERLETRAQEFAVDPIFGLQTTLPLLVGMLGVPDERVAEAMVTKAAAVGTQYDEMAQRHLEGVASGRVPARFAVEGTVVQLDEALAVPVAEDPVVAAVQLPDGVDEAGWRGRFAEALEQHVRPAMRRFRDVLADEVAPHARADDRVGLCWLEGGQDDYAALLRYYTTTRLSAQEIHDVGLAQVESLAQEYRTLGAEVLGTDDLDAIFAAMRDDPDLHFTEPEQLVEASKVAMERAWQAIPDWFETLPQSRCDVVGTSTGAKAFYFPPAADGSRGGSFFINVGDPTGWGTFELEPLAFHEGIPGHHLQLAIANELPESVPRLRKYAETASYAEGWGLYSERLADEMGLYSSPTDRLGMLSADSLRAGRLVVDTGLHALGWSRQQAVDYLVANSPMTESICAPEVDRYVVTPGQACSYMIGRLEILRMRREAQERQGGSFDIKAFHSAVLDSGTLPLDVLDSVVRRRLT